MTGPHPHQPHRFLGADHRRNERRTWLVIAITAAMMGLEIAAGSYFGSMALIADGWHMATHAGAMLINALAYLYARRWADDPRFTFGTGKLGDLAAFASAVVLAMVAVMIAWECAVRLANPVPIGYAEAVAVAVLGLVVNLVCAYILRDAPHHHPGHDHAHPGHDHDDHDDHHDHDHHDRDDEPVRGTDNNLRAAYLHVLADALTSVLAIVALTIGGLFDWRFLDPLMGIVGAVMIARWSLFLMRDCGAVLLDAEPGRAGLADDIRRAVESPDDSVVDLHVWQVGPGHHAVILSVVTRGASGPADYKARLAHLKGLSHVTVEVEAATA